MMQFKKRISPVCVIFLLISLIFSQGVLSTDETTIFESGQQGLSQSIDDTHDWWPMYQHDTMNSGYSISSGPDSNELSWIVNASEKITSISIADEKIFFGTEKNGYSVYSPSALYCVDLYGNMLWIYNTTGNLDATPLISSNKVYCTSENGLIYCVDAIDGFLIWERKISNDPISSPIISDDVIIVASQDRYVYCLDAETGEEIWSTTIGISIVSTPAVVNNSIFICNYCLDTQSGSKIWQSEVSIVLLSSAAYGDQKVFLGSRDEKLYCLDANNGEKLWRFYIGSMPYQYSPAVAYGNVYVGNAFGFIYCLDADLGEYVWSKKNSPRAVTSPAIADEKLYIGSVDGYLYCMNAFTGDVIWSVETTDAISCSPVIADDHVFIGSGKRLYCFGSPYQSRSDLSCDGDIQLSGLLPESIVDFNISIANVGEPYSDLDWRITHVPDWGEWSFALMQGFNLTPHDDAINIEGQVTIPEMRNHDFSGEIEIVNVANQSDYEIIEVSLSTNKYKPAYHVFFELLRQWVWFLTLMLNH